MSRRCENCAEEIEQKGQMPRCDGSHDLLCEDCFQKLNPDFKQEDKARMKNKEQIKADVRRLLKRIYQRIDDEFETRKINGGDEYDDDWLLLMISAQALREKEERDSEI